MSGPRGQARGGGPPGALRHPRGATPGPESEPLWGMGVGWGHGEIGKWGWECKGEVRSAPSLGIRPGCGMEFRSEYLSYR